MKKNLFCIWLLLAILFSVNMEAQMTIGGKKEPEAFSVLELLNKGGLRLPQMTTAERDAFAVKNNDKGNGLTIYNKTTDCVEYWNKTRWVSLCEGTSQTAISPKPCVDVAADGTGCDTQFSVTDPDCPGGEFTIAITAGSEYASLSEVDNVNGKFKINFYPNETVNTHTVLVRVTSKCTSLYKEFLFSQKGVDCTSMPYTAPAITASGTALCKDGSVYLSVPANTANLDKLIWTYNGVAVARGVNYYVATRAGKYNISMGAVGCNTNAANEKIISDSGTVAPANITINASDNGVLCGTKPVTLSVSGTTGAGTIAWFHNGVEEKSGTTAIIDGDSSVGEWFAVVKDGSCYSKQSNIIKIIKSEASQQITIADADVLVNGQPLKTFTAFCSGGSLDLSIANKQNGITYTWYNGNDVITSNPFIVPTSQSTISLRMVASDNSGAKCPAEQRVLDANIITGSTPGQPNITGNTILCDGSADLTIVPAVAGTYTYTWYKDNVKMSNTTQTITVSESGVYNATVTNTTGCASTMAVKTVSSTVSSLPEVSWVVNPATAYFGAKVTLQVSGTFNPTAYIWTADNNAVVTGSGASVSVQLPASGGDGLKVKITVTAKNDCGNSVTKVHEITVSSECPAPSLTAQSSTSLDTTAGSAVTVSVSAVNANQASYQWYSNASNSTTGGTAISGATTASYAYTPSAKGTYYLYCIITNGCTGNPKGTSPVFTLTVADNPKDLPDGQGMLQGKTCFDIAESNDNTTCGTLASRISLKIDFNTAANTQTYTFTPIGTVSKVRFVYVESLTGIVKSFIPDVDKSQALNVAGAVTAKMVYNSALSSTSAGAANGMAYGKSAADALKVAIYAIYNTKADGSGTDAKVRLTAEIKDCACCGAYTAPGVWKQFMCYNLGVTNQSLALDPFSPNPGLTGTLMSQPRTGWNSNGEGKKGAGDPCPDGYRVPSFAEWNGVAASNGSQVLLGTYGAGTAGIKFGNNLMLPITGILYYASGSPSVTGSFVSTMYWAAAPDEFFFIPKNGNSSSTFMSGRLGSTNYYAPVRCMAEN